MPTHKYLTKVCFNEEKSEIICYFKSSSGQSAERFPFKPYFVLSPRLNKEKIEELLLDSKFKNFQIIEKEGKLILISRNFENLKKINSFIAKTTNKKHVLLEPERVFLIEKDWSYFDCFDIESRQRVSQKDFAFLIFQIPFDEALCLNFTHSNFLIRQSALSNLLKVSMEKIPESKEEQTEVLLENIYFNGGIISWENTKGFFTSKDFVPFGEFDKISKIDFSPVWTQLLSRAFYNVGNETMNCSCCSPIKIDDSNLFPSTMIEVIPKEDFYYSSKSNSFSFNYHKNNSFQEKRKEKKKEFCLKEYPIGPIFKDKKIVIPLEDAKQLLDEKKVFLGKKHELNWFCKNKESFLSKEIQKMISKSKNTNKELSKIMIQLNEKRFEYYFLSELSKINKELFSEIAYQLTSPFSKFFSHDLAKAIVSIQESTVVKFREFSESNGYRVLFSSKKHVFVKGFSSLALTRKFSQKTSLPQPIISSISSKQSITDE
jgi:hypothetical protein